MQACPASGLFGYACAARNLIMTDVFDPRYKPNTLQIRRILDDRMISDRVILETKHALYSFLRPLPDPVPS